MNGPAPASSPSHRVPIERPKRLAAITTARHSKPQPITCGHAAPSSNHPSLSASASVDVGSDPLVALAVGAGVGASRSDAVLSARTLLEPLAVTQADRCAWIGSFVVSPPIVGGGASGTGE